MHFFMRLPILTKEERESYDSILVIINELTKMVHYELVKVIINTLGLAKVILDVVIWYHSLWDFIVTNRDSFFTSKFLLSLC